MVLTGMTPHHEAKWERTSPGTRQRLHRDGRSKPRIYHEHAFYPRARTPESSNHKAFDVEVSMAQALMPQDPNGRPAHFANNFEEVIFVFTVMMATAATTFLQGVIVINTVDIGKNLNMTESQVTWIAAAIGLASGSFMLFFGKTADLFGRKIQLLTGMAFLGFFSLLIAFSPGAIAMDVLCGFLGLGTAVISPPAIGTLFASYPEGKRRNMAAGALGAGNPLGFILGSISSGIATRIWSWRASFIVISIFFFVMTALAVWTMPSIPRIGNPRMAVKQFDYFGTVLTVVGMAMFTAGLTQGPDLGWKSPRVIITLALGILFIIGFAFWEKIHRHPLLDPAVWKNTNYTLCVLCTMFGYMSFVTNQFWIPLYMQQVQHLPPLLIAVHMLPQALSGFAWSYIGQALVSRLPGRVIMAIGGVCYLFGALLLIFIRPETSYWKFLFPAMVFTVVGADFQFIVSNLYVNKQMPTQASLAAGVIQTAYRLSVSIGLGITTAVYSSVQKTPKGMDDVTFPYVRVYICGVAFAAFSLAFLPFMRLEMQGSEEKDPFPTMTGNPFLDPRSQPSHPRCAGEYRDAEQAQNLSNKPSQNSIGTEATCGTEATYFQRWSWENDPYWPPNPDGFNRHDSHQDVVYEVCIKCLEERRVILPVRTSDGQGHNHDSPVMDGRDGWV